MVVSLLPFLKIKPLPKDFEPYLIITIPIILHTLLKILSLEITESTTVISSPKKRKIKKQQPSFFLKEKLNRHSGMGLNALGPLLIPRSVLVLCSFYYTTAVETLLVLFSRLLLCSLAMTAATAAGAAAAAAAVSLVTCFLLFHNSNLKFPWARTARPSCASGRRTRRRGLVEAIGNTPLIRINSLSDATGCEVGMWIFYLFFSALLPEQVLEVVLGLKKSFRGGRIATILPWVADFGEGRVPEPGRQREGPRCG
jgi:hypothetical protein